MPSKFNCNTCLYGTNHKSNYNRHMKSEKHTKKVEAKEELLKVDGIHEDTDLIKCPHCGLTYLRKSSLTRHINICGNRKLEEERKLDKLEMQIKIRDAQIELLKEACKNKPTNNTYISVRNFVQQNYSDAPPLEKMDDYSLIEFTEGLMDKLAYYQKNKILNKFLGDLLINWYKKEDPTQQSIWNSDVARLTYVIKELMANNKSCWNQDHKGLKTKEYIIHPLLEHIKSIIIKHLKKLPIVANNSIEDIIIILENAGALTQIKKDIDDGVLGEEIVKYLAPFFSIERNLLKN